MFLTVIKICALITPESDRVASKYVDLLFCTVKKKPV